MHPLILILIFVSRAVYAEDYRSSPVTPANSFTDGIEGPACDQQGNLYAVSYERAGTICKVTPDGKASLWAVVPNGGRVNGMRLDSQGYLIGADYINHLVHRIDLKKAAFVESLTSDWKGPEFYQPNDVGITKDDTIYFSDPDWKTGSGRIFMINRPPGRRTVLLEEGLRGPNGITVSPDERRVYVGQSRASNILVYDRKRDGTLHNKRVFIDFAASGIPASAIPDGIRCDVKGNLYVSMVNLGKVLIVEPSGKLHAKAIQTAGKRPANLTFCGSDGRTLYITEKEFGRIEKVRVDHRGER
jgi:gluconolactonase